MRAGGKRALEHLASAQPALFGEAEPDGPERIRLAGGVGALDPLRTRGHEFRLRHIGKTRLNRVSSESELCEAERGQMSWSRPRTQSKYQRGSPTIWLELASQGSRQI